MPTSFITAVQFDPPFSWDFSIHADGTSQAQVVLEKFLRNFKSALAKRQIRLIDGRVVLGSLVAISRIAGDPRLVQTRVLLPRTEPEIGAGEGEYPVQWSAALYADVSVFERLETGDVAKLATHLDSLRSQFELAAQEASVDLDGLAGPTG